MTETETININKQKLFNLAANLLVAFLNQPAENAKKIFKELKQGTVVKSGELTAEKYGNQDRRKTRTGSQGVSGPF